MSETTNITQTDTNTFENNKTSNQATSTDHSVTMVAGLDIGNGYVKGLVSCDGNQPTSIDFPSCVSTMSHTTSIKTPAYDAKSIIDDIFNNMDVIFDTPTVRKPLPRLFGKRGIQTDASQLEQFDVSGTSSKTKQELSAILILGSLAGKALQAYFNKYSSLPTDIIRAHCTELAIALPITEYKECRKEYPNKFINIKHMVNIHNFEQTIRVEVVIDDIQILAEGASAQYAIVDKGVPLMDAMLKDLRAHGEKLEGITANDVLAATNTLGIDIGEGTVNFPVFQNGTFNPDASWSYAKGYGDVLERAVKQLIENPNNKMPISTRKQLNELLLTPVNAINAKRIQLAQQIVKQEIISFVYQLLQQFKSIMSKSGAFIEVIYVYGGGASPIKEQLYSELIATTKEITGGDITPILYLDSRYSRHLNREGLYSIATKVANAKAAGKSVS